jgi:glutamate/tyrosine decarboxylase-like PLP-dependent enzyme
MELLGFGREALRLVGVDADDRVDVAALRARIAADRAAGGRPFFLIANAGTVNAGAIDDLERLADLARDEGLWLHVDGAFGALARLSPAHAALVRGLERADSLAFDLHKWVYMPFEAGCVLVRRPGVQREAFAFAPAYLAASDRGVSACPTTFADLGIELTRGFKALKVWMSLKAHGTRRIGELIGQNIEQARYLAGLVERSPRLALAAPAPLNVVCFRFVAPGVAPERLDALNGELLLRLQERGIAVPSATRRGERVALRVAIVNHRSVNADFEALVAAAEAIGEELLAEELLAEEARR